MAGQYWGKVMFTRNPFAELSAFVPPSIMQTYVVIMIILVVGGTLYDIIHKKSAKYFFDNWRNANNKGAQEVGSGEMMTLAIQTAVVDGLASGEFCNARRRIAHLLNVRVPRPGHCHSHSGVLLLND